MSKVKNQKPLRTEVNEELLSLLDISCNIAEKVQMSIEEELNELQNALSDWELLLHTDIKYGNTADVRSDRAQMQRLRLRIRALTEQMSSCIIPAKELAAS